ncbi:hypothetical protein BTVI_16476 [Pitangus sulphuratus]|nr:hypothetical protein BTVI_16476 [Pitangus sulphuratus]
MFWSSLVHRRFMEYAELEGTHQDHRVQLLAYNNNNNNDDDDDDDDDDDGGGTQCSALGDKVGITHKLDSRILEVFSNLNESLIL